MWTTTARPASLSRRSGLAAPCAAVMSSRRRAWRRPCRSAPKAPTLAKTMAAAKGGTDYVLRTTRRHGPRRAGQALCPALRRLHAGDAPLDRRDLVGGSGLVRRRPLSRVV